MQASIVVADLRSPVRRISGLQGAVQISSCDGSYGSISGKFSVPSLGDFKAPLSADLEALTAGDFKPSGAD
jgi:hypothetical protein